MNTKLIFIATLLTFLMSNCSNDEDGSPNKNISIGDCTFVQVDEDMDGIFDEQEQALWQDCIDSKLVVVEDIKENLIGEWELVGHMEGWIPKYSQPCSRVVISENEVFLDFHSNFVDTTITFPLKLNDGSTSGSFLFEGPQDLGWILPITSVSENLMVGPEGWIDANIYIYEKVD